MSSVYIVEPVELNQPRESVPIVSTLGQLIASVYVVELPAPASIHFGNGQAWPLEQGKAYNPCPAEKDGIRISNPVGAGTLVLAISMEQGEVGTQ